jgi:N6-L-threonylcarbamoyladenine synthase
MIVLGLESSCDETAAAVVADDGRVLSDVVRSQVAIHAPYGGVVPELAARDHMRAIGEVVRRALADAGLDLQGVDGIAATHRPGLMGALLVGLQAAKGLAWASGKPFVGVDHLHGHLLSAQLRHPDAATTGVEFPFLALLVSGGHTALYACQGPSPDAIREIGATRDDAVGEAYDKIAKLLGLGYPGGPVVDRLAAEGDPQRLEKVLPLSAGRADSPEFSFSGLKSAIARHVLAHGRPADPQGVADLCAAFQRVAVATLVDKTLRAARVHGLTRVVVVGGVAANRALRESMRQGCEARGYQLAIPPFRSCTDNAAMIAYAGALALGRGERHPLGLGPATHTALERVTRKGRGKRSVAW